MNLTRNDRLDRLPVTSKHKKLLGGSGIGWALDAMDVGLISFIMAALVTHWNLSATQASLLGSIGFVGMAWVRPSVACLLTSWVVGRYSPCPCLFMAWPRAPLPYRCHWPC